MKTRQLPFFAYAIHLYNSPLQHKNLLQIEPKRNEERIKMPTTVPRTSRATTQTNPGEERRSAEQRVAAGTAGPRTRQRHLLKTNMVARSNMPYPCPAFTAAFGPFPRQRTCLASCISRRAAYPISMRLSSRLSPCDRAPASCALLRTAG